MPLPASNTGMNDDHSLLHDIATGKRGAVEQLIQRHQALVLHMVGRLIDNPEDVRELCQEVFMRVYSRLHQFRGDSSLATWIGSIAFSIAAAHLRRKRIALVEVADDEHHDELLHNQPDPLDLQQSLMDADLSQQLHRTVAALAPLPRTLITMYYLDELPIDTIAAMTALPIGTVKSHLFRARQQLRQALGTAMDVPLERRHA